MTRFGPASKRLLFVLALLLCAALLFCSLSCVPAPFADAESAALSDAYLDIAGEDGDWYFSEEYLDIARACELVSAMRETYDLSELEEDPLVIAVIDTGVNIDCELFEEEDVFLRDAVGRVVWKDTVLGSSSPSDGASVDRHGTHVTGIVALLIRALGLSDVVKILPVKAGKTETKWVGGKLKKVNTFNYRDVSEAIDFALDNGADVVNLSLGSDSGEQWQGLVSEADSDRAVFVAAAGNYHNASSFEPFYPAASENVIGVMNYMAGEEGAELYEYQDDDGKTQGSNYGPLYDVCAPGTEILSADGDTGGYKTLSGTSMAAPVMSVAVALTMLNCRLSDFYASYEELKDIALMTSRESLSYNSTEYALTDLAGALSAKFERDAKGNVFLSAARDPEISVSPERVTAGESAELTFSADCGYLDTGARFKWTYALGGRNFTVEGERVSVTVTPSAAEDITVSFEAYTPDGRLVITKESFVVETGYLVPTPENSSVTMSLRPAEDGAVHLKEGETLVLGVDSLQFASPDTEVEWLVNGESAGTEHTFAFSPTANGSYFIEVLVDGVAIGEGVTVVGEGFPEEEDDRTVLIACLSAVGGAILIGGIAAIFIIRRRRARRAEDMD